jgi:hypothetical protein
MITKAFIQKLLATTSVTNLVGDRIEPNIIKPKTDLPALYVFTDRMTNQGCYDPMGARTGIVEIGLYAKSYTQAYEVMKAVRIALDDFTGVVNSVGIMIMRGEEVADRYDEDSDTHIKVIEYEAIAEPK